MDDLIGRGDTFKRTDMNNINNMVQNHRETINTIEQPPTKVTRPYPPTRLSEARRVLNCAKPNSKISHPPIS